MARLLGPNLGWHVKAIYDLVLSRPDSALVARVGALPGETVGFHTIIGSGSVVTRDLPSGVVPAAVPAIVVRQRSGGTPLLLVA